MRKILLAILLLAATAEAGLIFDNATGTNDDTLAIQFEVVDSAGMLYAPFDTAFIFQVYGGEVFFGDTLIWPADSAVVELSTVYPRNLMYEYHVRASNGSGSTGAYTWWVHTVRANNGTDCHKMSRGNYYVNSDPVEDFPVLADTAYDGWLGKLVRDVAGDSGWQRAVRILTALDEDDTDLDLDGTQVQGLVDPVKVNGGSIQACTTVVNRINVYTVGICTTLVNGVEISYSEMCEALLNMVIDSSWADSSDYPQAYKFGTAIFISRDTSGTIWAGLSEFAGRAADSTIESRGGMQNKNADPSDTANVSSAKLDTIYLAGRNLGGWNPFGDPVVVADTNANGDTVLTINNTYDINVDTLKFVILAAARNGALSDTAFTNALFHAIAQASDSGAVGSGESNWSDDQRDSLLAVAADNGKLKSILAELLDTLKAYDNTGRFQALIASRLDTSVSSRSTFNPAVTPLTSAHFSLAFYHAIAEAADSGAVGGGGGSCTIPDSVAAMVPVVADIKSHVDAWASLQFDTLQGRVMISAQLVGGSGEPLYPSFIQFRPLKADSSEFTRSDGLTTDAALNTRAVAITWITIRARADSTFLWPIIPNSALSDSTSLYEFVAYINTGPHSYDQTRVIVQVPDDVATFNPFAEE